MKLFSKKQAFLNTIIILVFLLPFILSFSLFDGDVVNQIDHYPVFNLDIFSQFSVLGNQNNFSFNGLGIGYSIFRLTVLNIFKLVPNLNIYTSEIFLYLSIYACSTIYFVSHFLNKKGKDVLIPTFLLLFSPITTVNVYLGWFGVGLLPISACLIQTCIAKKYFERGETYNLFLFFILSFFSGMLIQYGLILFLFIIIYSIYSKKTHKGFVLVASFLFANLYWIAPFVYATITEKYFYYVSDPRKSILYQGISKVFDVLTYSNAGLKGLIKNSILRDTLSLANLSIFSFVLFRLIFYSSRSKTLILFCLTILISMSMGNGSPVYMFFLKYIPGFYIYRDCFKFIPAVYIIVYSLLIGMKDRNAKILLIICTSIYLASHFYSVFSEIRPQSIPKEYKTFSEHVNTLSNNDGYFLLLVPSPDWFSKYDWTLKEISNPLIRYINSPIKYVETGGAGWFNNIKEDTSNIYSICDKGINKIVIQKDVLDGQGQRAFIKNILTSEKIFPIYNTQRFELYDLSEICPKLQYFFVNSYSLRENPEYKKINPNIKIDNFYRTKKGTYIYKPQIVCCTAILLSLFVTIALTVLSIREWYRGITKSAKNRKNINK